MAVAVGWPAVTVTALGLVAAALFPVTVTVTTTSVYVKRVSLLYRDGTSAPRTGQSSPPTAGRDATGASAAAEELTTGATTTGAGAAAPPKGAVLA